MTSSIIWPKFDIILTWHLTWHLTSFWHHFDVTIDVIDDVILTSKHWCHFDGEIFGQFWRQTSNVNEKNWRHVNSFTRIWPNIDVWRMTIIDVYLMSIYVKLMWNWCEIDVYLMTNWCLFDVKLMSIWCLFDVDLMLIWRWAISCFP